ncbi:Crp/Fnr family transcriptional regulator [Flexithrix dorotheae]|uniref:Crp/Fnr family transcriptional regulator n=1 Tax=Flexithrix dorotheae TaxID=70993 RepID=UPI00036B2AE5|nr:Crp/Fnr family transcriptional regulator [Flexithrix dorotheae]
MEKAQIIEIVSDIYSPLNEECKIQIYQKSKVLTFGKGEILVKAGAYCDKSYFLAKGGARTFYLKDGRDVTDWFAFENSFISSINSFFYEVPSENYIELLEDSTLLVLSKSDIEDLCNKFHDFEKLNKVVFAKTMLQLQERIVSMRFFTAKQKYIALLKSFPKIDQRVQLSHIASYIGITLETLSRLRSRI